MAHKTVLQCTLAVLALATLLSGCVGRTVDIAPEPTRVTVMAYNIRHCRGTDDAVDINRIAAAINRANPDLVSLQEVDVRVRRSGEVDQVAELGRLTGLHAQFGKARDYDGGEYGQAILSRLPIEFMTVHKLPGATDGEERIALFAQVADGTLFIGTHLHHQGEEHRLAQTDLLLKIINDQGNDTVILTGDLNALPTSATLQRFHEEWNDTDRDGTYTFPAEAPNRKIDYILVQKDGPWRALSSHVMDEPLASDHRPLIAVLEKVR